MTMFGAITFMHPRITEQAFLGSSQNLATRSVTSILQWLFLEAFAIKEGLKIAMKDGDKRTTDPLLSSSAGLYKSDTSR